MTENREALPDGGDLPRHALHRCDDPGCFTCQAGKRVCTVCGGVGDWMPNACPGRQLTPVERQAAKDGRLDFVINGPHQAVAICAPPPDLPGLANFFPVTKTLDEVWAEMRLDPTVHGDIADDEAVLSVACCHWVSAVLRADGVVLEYESTGKGDDATLVQYGPLRALKVVTPQKVGYDRFERPIVSGLDASGAEIVQIAVSQEADDDPDDAEDSVLDKA